MFNINITPEQIAAAEAYAQQQQTQQAASVAQQAQNVQQVQESPVAPPVTPSGPKEGMLVGGLNMGMPEPYNPPPVVAPPTPQQPVPPMQSLEIGSPQQMPLPPEVVTPSTQQPLPTKPEGPYINPLDEYYVTDAQNKAEGKNTSVYVSGEGREDENGLSQMARLDILDSANQDLVPEGYEAGFQGNSLIHLMYGGLNPGPQASNPDYQAGQNGNTVGGIGNKDAWGNDINWSKPQTAQGGLGQVVNTPAGDYLVVNGAEGNLALMPLSGAKAGVGKFFYNLASGEHHVGINPQTGEVWYQQAAGYTNWDRSKWTNPNYGGSNAGGSSAPSQPNPNNNPEDDATHPSDNDTPQEETSPQPEAPTPPTLSNPYGQSGAFTGTGIGYPQQQRQEPEQQQSQQKVDYVKLLNKMMAQSLFKDMT
jgi:hypothetical protein